MTALATMSAGWHRAGDSLATTGIALMLGLYADERLREGTIAAVSASRPAVS